MTVGEWVNIWLHEYSSTKVRLTTWESYENLVNTHIVPSIGKIMLRELRPDQLQRMYNQKLKNGRVDGKGGLSTATVKHIHAIMKQSLKYAVRNRLIARNVADDVDPPKLQKQERKPLTPEQLRIFLSAIDGHRNHAALLLECYTGFRRGELLGIRWQDIDFQRSTVTCRQSLNNTNKGLSFSDCKTKASRRTIPLPPEVMAVLKTHRKKQLEDRLAAGQAYQDNDLAFCTALGKPLDPSNFVRDFEKILERAGLPIVTFHDMRHSHATLLIQEGVNPKVVSERLGHTTVRMTLDTYSHVLPGMQEKATDIIKSALGK